MFDHFEDAFRVSLNIFGSCRVFEVEFSKQIHAVVCRHSNRCLPCIIPIYQPACQNLVPFAVGGW